MAIEQLRVRQIRRFSRDPVSDDAIAELLQIARWTGSWANSQPWHFVVIRDRDALRRISELRPPMSWLADVPLAIAIVLDRAGTSQAYDEGRVTEDRKSTRLNSSHPSISYAVFCLKKKK